MADAGEEATLQFTHRGGSWRQYAPSSWSSPYLPSAASITSARYANGNSGRMKLIKQNAAENGPNKVTHVHELDFIKERYKGIIKDSMILCWLHSFCKQFRGRVTKSDHHNASSFYHDSLPCANPKFDFHKYYMLRALESDFKKIVGTRLPHILLDFIPSPSSSVSRWPMTSLRSTAIGGDLIVKPSDEHLWFGQPKIVLHLVHLIIFQNAFELAYFFYVLLTYGFESCFMDHVGFLVPRLVVGIINQLTCSYSTLPLWGIFNSKCSKASLGGRRR